MEKAKKDRDKREIATENREKGIEIAVSVEEPIEISAYETR